MERYCPDCKHNVPAEPCFCINCGYEFSVSVDKEELESLIELFEILIVVVYGLARRLDLPTSQDRGRAMAAKFREKYLEAK